MSLLRKCLPILAALGFGAAACDSPADPATGTVTIQLTDAPGDVLQAWVTIERIEMAGGPEAEEGAEGEGGTEGAGTEVMTAAVTTDLLTLQGQAMTLVQDFAVAAGTYQQLRFIVSAACLEVEGTGTETSVYSSSTEFTACGDPTGTLVMPGLAQSGLKVILPGGGIVIGDGEGTTTLVDFDVAESFGQEAGQSGRWVMHPVIRAVEAAGEGSED